MGGDTGGSLSYTATLVYDSGRPRVVGATLLPHRGSTCQGDTPWTPPRASLGALLMRAFSRATSPYR